MRRLRAMFGRARRPAPLSVNASSPVERYLAGGRKPWSEGYWQYRQAYIAASLRDEALMERFRQGGRLPDGYGWRLDERVVEYPWVLARLAESSAHLLDAGATLIYPFLHEHRGLASKTVVVYTLEPEETGLKRKEVSFIYGDLRRTMLRDEIFDEIVSISTLEHIGLDNTLVYTDDERYREARPGDFRIALNEFRRLLRPGGRLFVTLPYGRYENLTWMQQFDQALVEEAIGAFGGRLEERTFFRYSPDGWQRAEAEECRDCRYFDVRRTPDPEADGAAAARAVVCLQVARA